MFGDVEISLVKRQWLDDRRVIGKDFPDLQRDRLIRIEARLNEDQIGTFPLGGYRRHRRMDPERARFVARGNDDTSFARPANRDRLAA